jgi:magnesium-transporting ATPase (P-type)
MSIVVRQASTQLIFVFVKGADSSVIKMCDISSKKEIKGVERDLLNFQMKGLRTLVFA